GVEHIVEDQDVGPSHLKRHAGLTTCRQAALGKVVAVHDRRHLTRFTGQAQVALQALGQPGTTRGDAHEAGVVLTQAAHAAQEFLVQGFCIQRQSTHGRLLKHWSRMIAAAAASASLAP
ncbi:MAG: hypothetical protein AN485_23775, partial [Anabaena sp. MDT14b]